MFRGASPRPESPDATTGLQGPTERMFQAVIEIEDRAEAKLGPVDARDEASRLARMFLSHPSNAKLGIRGVRIERMGDDGCASCTYIGPAGAYCRICQGAPSDHSVGCPLKGDFVRQPRPLLNYLLRGMAGGAE